ncbi:hypothetical protein BROUX41_002568 [Berkeleyomyces rouxiae]
MDSTNPSFFPILNLPLDITFALLTDHSDPISAVSLSLTCKPLYHAFFNQSLRRLTTRADKTAFLTLLETCSPSSVLCFACLKLHPLASARPVGVPASPLELGWHCQYSYAWMPAGGGGALGLSFRDARAAALHAHTGRGLAVHDLNVCVTQGRRWRSARTVAVGPVGRLVARCEHTFEIAGLDLGEAMALVQSARLGLCQHVEVEGAAVRDVKAMKGGTVELQRCDRCATDWSIEWLDGSRVSVCSWHDFGSCLTPFEKEWHDATARRRRSAGEVKDDDAAEPGLVYNAWVMAAGA